LLKAEWMRKIEKRRIRRLFNAINSNLSNS